MATMKTVVASALAGALVAVFVTREMMRGDQGIGETAKAAPVAAAKGRHETPAPVRPPDASIEASKPAVAAKSALAAAFDAVEIDTPRFGAGSITGRVLTPDGAGVAGVTVKAQSRSQPRASASASGTAALTPDEDAVRNAVVWKKWNDATSREVVTDSSGAFALTKLVDGKFNVWASAKGWSVRVAPGSNANDVGAGSTVEFVATATVDVPVRVVLADGTPCAEQVLVRWSHPKQGGGSSAWWKPDAPVIAIDPGDWMLTAEKGRGSRSKAVPVTAVAGATIETVTLAIEMLGSVAGVVRFEAPDGAWERARVNLRRKGSTERRAEQSSDAAPPAWKFAFESVESGEYELTVENARYSGDPALSVPVKVAAERVTQDLVVPAPDPKEWMVVRVTGPDGQPLPPGDLSFALKEEGVQLGGAYGSTYVARADGSFLVALKVRAGGGKELDFSAPEHVGADWRLDVRSTSCGNQLVAFDRGKTPRLDVAYTSVAKFIPTFAGVAGSALEGRVKAALGYVGQSYGAAFNNTFNNFNQDPGSVRSVQPGRYVAWLWLSSNGGSSPFEGRVLSRTVVDLVAGENAVTLRVPDLHTLAVRVSGLTKGAEINVEPAELPRAGGNAMRVVADDTGLASFGELVAGAYRVHLLVSGETQEMVVRVPVSGEVAFAPTTLAGLAVQVDDPSGLLAKTGFQDGDVIVSIDGAVIDSVKRLEGVLYGARGKGSVDAEVRRGGSSTRIPFDPAKFSIRSDYGGTWEPLLR